MSRTTWLGIAVGALVLGGCSCNWFSSEEMDAGPEGLGVGEACATDRNCRAGLVCDTGTCQPAGDGLEGQVCTLTGDCGDGLYCNERRVCAAAGDAAEGDACDTTADCEKGLMCRISGFGFSCGPTGDGDLGAECVGDADCLAGLRCLRGDTGLACQSPPAIEGDAGPGGGPPPVLPFWEGETCEEDDGPPTAYFRLPRGDGNDGDFYRLPFPNDARRNDVGGLDLTGHPSPATALEVDVLGRHIDAAEQDLDGFATNPVIYFRFSAPYDWGSVSAERVWLVDLSPGSPEYGRNLGRGWQTTSGRITRYICPNWLAIRRGHGAPLRPGTTYAAILLDGIRADESRGFSDIGRDPDLDAVLADTAPTEAPLDRAWDAYAPLRAWLAEDGTPNNASILNATVFTTQRATRPAQGLRQAVRGATAPTIAGLTLCDAGVTSPCDDGAQRVCSAANDDYWELHAEIQLPQFQQGTPPFENPEDGGGITNDGSGVPVVQRTEPVCMVMTIPKGVAQPTDGFPVVIYAHGTGGAATAAVQNGLAADFANASTPAVTVAIDMPLHGSRRGDSTREPDVLVFNFENPRAARDNFLQGSADLMAVVRWLEGATVAAADLPTGFDLTFDAAHLGLFAHSQGATHAQLIAPYEEGLVAIVLSGAGGDLTESLLTKTKPVNVAGILPLALLDPTAEGTLVAGDHHPALALFQMFYERVDPVNFGRLYRREPPADDRVRHVFMTYGMGDSFSTERTMRAFAQSVGFPHVGPTFSDLGLGDPVPPPLSGNVTLMDVPFTVGLRQYEPDDYDGHFVSTRHPTGRADAIRFLVEALAGDVPSVGP